MASYLLDTNILLRTTNSADPRHLETKTAVDKLISQDDLLCVTAQNLIEFWAVASRPREANGLGWGNVLVALVVQAILMQFSFLEDKPAVFQQWLQLVSSYGVQGKQVHDLRLVAVMQAYAIHNLLTLNKAHFPRYKEITPFAPVDVI